jgi:NADPH:quinone reductase-like Zn-dependent oxidoreductase
MRSRKRVVSAAAVSVAVLDAVGGAMFEPALRSLRLGGRQIAITRTGERRVSGRERLQTDPHWRDLIPFHEYFHRDTGAGLGASHQTGWIGLVAKLLQQSGE